jgi:hypothetical protein
MLCKQGYAISCLWQLDFLAEKTCIVEQSGKSVSQVARELWLTMAKTTRVQQKQEG